MSYYSRAIVNAPAKVNLSLDIKGVDGNGYHLMEMIMLSVELSDIVIINRNESNIIKTTSSSSEIPQSDGNIATIAAKFFF